MPDGTFTCIGCESKVSNACKSEHVKIAELGLRVRVCSISCKAKLRKFFYEEDSIIILGTKRRLNIEFPKSSSDFKHFFGFRQIGAENYLPEGTIYHPRIAYCKGCHAEFEQPRDGYDNKYCTVECYKQHVQSLAFPIGTERTRDHKKYGKVIYVKTETGWIEKARMVFDEYNGFSSSGRTIIYLDGNGLNVDPSNLVLRPRRKSVDVCPVCEEVLVSNTSTPSKCSKCFPQPRS